MDVQDPDKNVLTKRSINVQKLLKNFNPKDFARSLLPRPDIHESVKHGEDETTYYGQFLDDLEENLQKNNQLPDILSISEIDNLRVWSRVVFKEKKREATEDFHYETQITQDVKDSQSKDKSSVDSTCEQILSRLKEDEVKTESVIKKFLHEEIELNCSSGESINRINHAELIKHRRFFYLDAFENLFGNNKTVHLFGKTYCPQRNQYISCCVAVGPLKRRLFVLPRSKLSNENSKVELLFNQEQILEEFYCIALKPLEITKFNFRFVLKKNLDSMLGPKEILFMEIEYSSQYPPVDQGVEGISFCKIYGVKRNHFENFLLEKSIKGPCWLDISNPKETKNKKTWCALEISCSPEEIYLTDMNLNLQVPPLTILSMYIRSVENLKEKSREIALISCAICKNYDMSRRCEDLNSEKSYCVFITPRKAQPLPKIYETFRRTVVKSMSSENDLLNYFLAEFNEIDPDIIIGFDFQNKEFHNLADRLVSLKIEDFCRLGRFRGTPQHTDVKAFLFSGRLICDLKIIAKDFFFSKYQELETLYEKFLNFSNEQRYSNVDIFFSPHDKLMESVVFTTNEAIYLLKVVFNSYIIPLILKLSNICGTSFSQTFAGGVSKRSEFLLLHAFHEKGFVLPDSHFKRAVNDRCEKELPGGLVLEPKVGFYDNFVLLMDFQSLYPSIIQEYNLCLSHSDVEHQRSSLGVIPSLMKQLIEKRRKVITLMNTFDKESFSYSRYKVYQSALKLSSNGIYGCLASRFFRFYCPEIAARIVEKARETLRSSVHILQNQGFEIIYGDTDSMMINTKSKDFAAVHNIAEQINCIINKNFSTIELKVDSIFQRLLIIGKKKYAGIEVQCNTQDFQYMKYETILKGLDIIRSDWPLYVCQMGRVAIDYILSDICLQAKISKITELMNQVKQDLINHRVPKQSLVITKYLTQDPENYSSKNLLPHVEVALRCNKGSFFHFRKGDAVSYVMCYNEDSFPPKRAFHLRELKRCPGWKVDAMYYLQKQFYPMIWRICSCLEGMRPDIEAISDTKYPATKDGEKEPPPRRINKMEFHKRDPFTFKCIECKRINIITLDLTSNETLKLLTCQNSDCTFSPLNKPKYLRNQLVCSIRRYISTYYKYESTCSNSRCKYSSRRVSLNSVEVKNNCPACKKDVLKPTFSANDLFLQLKYFRNIFDNEISLSSEQWIIDVYNELLNLLGDYEKHSDFGNVNLTQLFWNY